MTKEEQTRVLKVLNYWKTLELLSQENIKAQSSSSRKELNAIRETGKIPSRKTKLEVFHDLDGNFDLKQTLEEDSRHFGSLPVTGDECYFCMGKILRNDLADHLAKYVPNRDEVSEIAYDNEDAIAWFSFRTDTDGRYVEYSFKLSPILWVIKQWEEKNAARSRDFSFNMKEHKADSQKIIDALKEKYREKGELNTAFFLADIYNRISDEYVKPYLSKFCKMTQQIGFCEYNRYKNTARKNKDAFPENYANLGFGFFSKDLEMLENEIKFGGFGDDPERENYNYERSVINFILSADLKNNGTEISPRTVISARESAQHSLGFFKEKLDIRNAPNGKWPALFMPSLMQQTAVNLAINKSGETPIFSVNGPPGTGKTTLLKEVLASSIVERAFLLADSAGDDPDSIFEECHFKNGNAKNHGYLKSAPNYYKLKIDEINDYGMLVTSCNNAAVENITLDLPRTADLLKNLDSKNVRDETVKNGIDENRRLFDPALSDDIENVEIIEEIKVGDKTEEKLVRKDVRDIFFTRYADKLSKNAGCWGLISAPLGRQGNIKRYCSSVLKPFLNDYGNPEARAAHLEKYIKLRDIFLKQYHAVQLLKTELAAVCDDCAVHGDLFELPEKFTAGENKMSVINKDFILKYSSENEEGSTAAQLSNPWATDKFNREREKLFYYACKLHKEFAASSDAIRQNIENIIAAWELSEELDRPMNYYDLLDSFPALLQSLFLLTPVISTTFASVNRFLQYIKPGGVIGMLIVDEAGQAQPYQAIGALCRCRKAVIVGDPKQIEPVVTADADMFKQIMSSELLDAYKDKRASVQGFADYLNPYGTYLGQGAEREWVGCPLVVHRRCADPMYSISNELSYDNTMKCVNKIPDKQGNYILPESCWINVSGTEDGIKRHYVKEQGEIVLKLLKAAFGRCGGDPKLFIITPFTSVKSRMIDEIENSELYESDERVKAWIEGKNIGTVHTFQGKETDEVIFLLGCDFKSTSAANWVNKNIVNVAATRARQRLYVIGDEAVWKNCDPVITAKRIIKNDITPECLDRMLGENAVDEPSMICPKCGNDLIRKSGSRGEFFGCSSFPECKFTCEIDTEFCPECGKPLKERNGPHGKFIGCTGYPECRFTRNIENSDE